MAKGRKLTATSEFGTFTRHTHHDYKFVVIALQSEEARQELIKQADHHVAWLQGLIDTQTPAEIEGRRYYKTSTYSSIQAEVVIVEARERAERLRQPRVYADINWCGRRDLAEKAASRLQIWGGNKHYEAIHIVTVDGQ